MPEGEGPRPDAKIIELPTEEKVMAKILAHMANLPGQAVVDSNQVAAEILSPVELKLYQKHRRDAVAQNKKRFEQRFSDQEADIVADLDRKDEVVEAREEFYEALENAHLDEAGAIITKLLARINFSDLKAVRQELSQAFNDLYDYRNLPVANPQAPRYQVPAEVVIRGARQMVYCEIAIGKTGSLEVGAIEIR